jgi:hypothetical protein
LCYRSWTKEEQDALLLGIDKHGTDWVGMSNDTSLGLGRFNRKQIRDKARSTTAAAASTSVDAVRLLPNAAEEAAAEEN